jgi:choline-sulfatase
MSAQPNILFLLSDEHSYRCFGYLDPNGEGEPVHTPVLDALAAQAAVFQQTYCQVALCTPSRICMLTGLSPMQSGGWVNWSYLKPGNKTLPQAFAEAGYVTCLVGKMHLGGNRQFVGFQHRPYGDLTGAPSHQFEPLLEQVGIEFAIRGWMGKAGVTEIPESILQEQVVSRETIAFLREHRHARPDQPWFLCASFSRPHWPATVPRRYFERYWPDGVTPPKAGRTGDTTEHPITQCLATANQSEKVDEETAMRARAAYFGCVDYLDEILGDLLLLLERDGLLENTIVVYASDHGELAGEHGLWGKGTWHEASVRAPWMVQLPEHRKDELAAVRLQTPVSLADLYPTLCGLAGVKAPDDLDGVDLSSAVRNGREPDRGPVSTINHHHRDGNSRHYVLRKGRHKYVRCRPPVSDLLFDLEDDPFEQTNLLINGRPEHADIAERMRKQIDRQWDFGAADEQRKRDQAEGETNALPTDLQRDPSYSVGNLYLMSDNRLVAADTPLYDPVTLTDRPQDVFADWPGND